MTRKKGSCPDCHYGVLADYTGIYHVFEDGFRR